MKFKLDDVYPRVWRIGNGTNRARRWTATKEENNYTSLDTLIVRSLPKDAARYIGQKTELGISENRKKLHSALIHGMLFTIESLATKTGLPVNEVRSLIQFMLIEGHDIRKVGKRPRLGYQTYQYFKWYHDEKL